MLVIVLVFFELRFSLGFMKERGKEGSLSVSFRIWVVLGKFRKVVGVFDSKVLLEKVRFFGNGRFMVLGLTRRWVFMCY